MRLIGREGPKQHQLQIRLQDRYGLGYRRAEFTRGREPYFCVYDYIDNREERDEFTYDSLGTLHIACFSQVGKLVKQ